MLEINLDLDNELGLVTQTTRQLHSTHCKLNLHAKKIATLKKCSIEDAFAHIIDHGIKSTDRELDAAPAPVHTSGLSPRQTSVLQGLRAGLAVKEIADKLNVGEATVRTHIIRIRERTGCLDILKLRIP
jgi:DNA-binding NarL/FixJ family response regulator